MSILKPSTASMSKNLNKSLVNQRKLSNKKSLSPLRAYKSSSSVSSPVKIKNEIIKLSYNWQPSIPIEKEQHQEQVTSKESFFNERLVFKNGPYLNRISDMTKVQPNLKSNYEQVMRFLFDLSLVMDSEVWQLETSYLEDWPRIISLMRHFVSQKNTQIEGSSLIEDPTQACQMKRIAVFMILDAICNFIREYEFEAFFCLYWALKSFGQIAMDFKDLEMARIVFTRLKNECQDRMEFEHKMMTYKQLGYIYRSLKNYKKATLSFKKFLQLAWFNKDQTAELIAYQNLSIDYFYLADMGKASYYDRKFQEGIFENADSVVRRQAVSIIENQIKNIAAGRPIGHYIQGKFVKTSFNRMPSPSSFGGGHRMRQTTERVNDELDLAQKIKKEDYEDYERKKKPFADFTRPELQHLNEPAWSEYLK